MAEHPYIRKASYSGCPVEDRARFHNSHCLMPISAGQSVHEKDKFEATLQLVNRTFKKCTILIDDTVQRHTLKIHRNALSDSEAAQLAFKLGDDWLERNLSTINNNCRIEHEIIRWDIWRTNPNFDMAHQKVTQLLQENIDYLGAFKDNAKTFLSRNLSRSPSSISWQCAEELVLTYLKEECAVMCLWVLGGYDFEVYPHTRNQAMNATYKYLIKPQYPDLLKPVSLRFKKYSMMDIKEPIT